MKSFKDVIKKGGVAVIKTDTLYGLVCDARNHSAVDRIYTLKKRDKKKPCIVLVANYEQIKEFGINVNSIIKTLDVYWPGKVSIILPAQDNSVNTHYIHRGTGGIAFRLPANDRLRKLLIDVGPLVAPSANPEGKPAARDISEAMDYFGDQVDYYLDGGIVKDARASKIIKISNNVNVKIIRD
ncbi:MAG: L-threonylcarbamoyladenylate synthase [Crocinitomicaceae bacterium]|jgi:L-threonylcarbamoyladenylate synthase